MKRVLVCWLALCLIGCNTDSTLDSIDQNIMVTSANKYLKYGDQVEYLVQLGGLYIAMQTSNHANNWHYKCSIDDRDVPSASNNGGIFCQKDGKYLKISHQGQFKEDQNLVVTITTQNLENKITLHHVLLADKPHHDIFKAKHFNSDQTTERYFYILILSKAHLKHMSITTVRI